MTPPPSQHKKSLQGDTAPELARTDHQVQPALQPEQSPETAAEQRQVGRMETMTGSARARTDISIARLAEKAGELTKDKQTPQLINELNFAESPDTPSQTRRFEAFCAVTPIAFAKILYSHPALEQNMGKPLEHLELFESKLSAVSAAVPVEPSGPPADRQAVNAAFRKMREFRDHPDHAVTARFHELWKGSAGKPSIAKLAVDTAKGMRTAIAVDLSQPAAPQEQGTITQYIRENPKKAAAYGILGALGLFAIGYGIYKLIRGNQPQNQPQAGAEAPTGKTGWLKWLPVFGLGSLLGWGVFKWIKDGLKLDPKGIWDSMFGENPEWAQHREVYTRMAGIISKEMAIGVDKKFLAEVATEKYSDVVEDESWWQEYLSSASDAVTDTPVIGRVATALGAHTKGQRQQMKVIRAYLIAHQAEVVALPNFDASTMTLGQVLVRLDAKLHGTAQPTGATPGASPAPAPTGAPETAATLEARLLPHLERQYGASVETKHVQCASVVPYKQFMLAAASRSKAQEYWNKARTVLAEETGFVPATTQEQESQLRAETTLRRFFQDNERLLTDLPASATVGMALARLMEHEAELGTRVLPDQEISKLDEAHMPGIIELEAAARLLPPEKFALFQKQHRELEDMVKDGQIVTDYEVETLTAAGEKILETIQEKKINPNPAERAKYAKMEQALLFRIKRVREALTARNAAQNAYHLVIQQNLPEAQFHLAFASLQKRNDELLSACNVIDTMLAQDRMLESIAVLAGVQAGRIAYVYATRPPKYRAYAKHYYGILGGKKIKAVLSGIFGKTPTGVALAEQRVRDAELRLNGPLGGADSTGMSGSLKQRANLRSDTSGLRDVEKPARNRYISELDLLDHDKKMLASEQEIEVIRRDLAQLKQSRSTVDARKAADVEKLLKDRLSDAKTMSRARIILEQEAIADAAEDLHVRIAKNPGEAFSENKWNEIDDLAQRGAANNRSIMKEGEEILQDIQRAVRRGATAAEIQALQIQFNTMLGGVTQNQKNLMMKLANFIELRLGKRVGRMAGKAMRAPGAVSEGLGEAVAIRDVRTGLNEGADAKHFRKVLATILHWQKKSSGVKAAQDGRPMFQVVKGKAKFLGLKLGIMGAVAGTVGAITSDKQTGWGRATGQVAIDMAPLSGTASDFYTAVTGREFLTNRTVTGFERLFMRPLCGVVGLASDVLWIAGIGVAMRGGVNLVKGGMEVSRVARLRTAVDVAAEAGTKAAAKTAARAAGNAPQDAGMIMNFLRGVDQHRTIATIGLTAAGVGVPLTMSLFQEDEWEVPEAIQAVAGGPDGRLDEIDIS